MPDEADGFVVLTSEYNHGNHGYPAVLKNAMDHTFVEWRRKPMTSAGGPRRSPSSVIISGVSGRHPDYPSSWSSPSSAPSTMCMAASSALEA
jgi:hypothetical protein